MSPESFLEGVFNSKSDIWMFGVCMWGKRVNYSDCFK